MSLTLLEISKFNNNENCVFCGRNTVEEFQLGKIYKYRSIVVHYFCLLFATHLCQNGSDDKGVLGFLIPDIKREVKMRKTSICYYCRQPGATAFCGKKGCRIRFHFPCGLENNSFHIFANQFPSYCFSHRRIQTPRLDNGCANFNELCVICQSEVIPKPSYTSIWAPCCKRTWFHKNCVQKLALNSGYFFKCAKCCNENEFRREMLKCGIYIPDRDASWELEPHSFQELNERYNSCDANKCICPDGSKYSKPRGDWKIILCNCCGSQGLHKKCGAKLIAAKGEWTCKICSSVVFSKKIRKRQSSAIAANEDESNIMLYEKYQRRRRIYSLQID